jgi:hypothetical protein
MSEPCRVYWGTHGCRLPRGHDGPHLCECADDEGASHVLARHGIDPQCVNVGAPPYYGPDTRLYGEDAAGLPA